MTIYAALADVMAEVSHVAKRDVNTHQKFNFRGIDAVVNAVGPALRKHRVIVVPSDVTATYEQVSTTTGKPATACRVDVTYTFYAEDGTSIPVDVAGEAWDSGDKATPKAMSVAFRTALLQALALPTDEPDPDSHTYERATVDLRLLDQLIVTAQDVGIEKDWDRLRKFAAQSPDHLAKAVDKLEAAINSSDVGGGEAPASEGRSAGSRSPAVEPAPGPRPSPSSAPDSLPLETS
jgi:hypothetical protein